MAKAMSFISVLCILAFATIAHGHQQDVFHVEGDVYCDPCRVQFETELSNRLVGATVKLECKNLVTNAVTFTKEGVTGVNGHYSIHVEGDHENDSCEVSVVKSPMEDCSVPMDDFDKAKIECTDNSGMHSAVRFANPIGFMTKAALPECGPVLYNMGIILS